MNFEKEWNWQSSPDEIDFIQKIDRIIKNIVDEKIAIKGIVVGSHGGTLITSKFKPNHPVLVPKETVAATTSLLFVSRQAVTKMLDEELQFVMTCGANNILLSFLTRNISFGAILDRNLVELDGIEQYVNELKVAALKVSAIIETSDIEQEDLFTKIKVAIPDATIYAITTRDGLPIKIQSNLDDEAKIAAFMSAVFNVNDFITKERPEFTTIVGEHQSIIIHAMDKSRLLSLAVPGGDYSTLMKYIMKIKRLITDMED